MIPFPSGIEKNREFLEAYVSAIISNIRIVVLDAAYRIVWVNDRFCALTQYGESELIGRSVTELHLLCHDEIFFKGVYNVISGGVRWSGEVQIQTKFGITYWVKATVLPIKNKRGEVESYLVLNSDITATKTALKEKEAALEQLLQSEARYRALVENQVDMISLCDPRGNRIYVNASFCHFFGKTFDELIGTNVIDLPLLGLPVEVIRQGFKLTPASPEFSGIYELENANRQKFWISGRAKGIFDAQGNLFEILTIGRDVTSLKNAELQKSNYIDDLERIAFMTSHNVRGPIASMLGLIELLRLNAIDTDKWHMALDTFKQCIIDLDLYTREMGAFIYQRQSSS